MIISERIFEILKEKGMSQKEFADKTGIAPSTISDWKSKHTNPIAEKIMIICQTLEVTPEELLSGVDISGSRSRAQDYYVIDRTTDLGVMIEAYQELDQAKRNQLLEFYEQLKQQ